MVFSISHRINLFLPEAEMEPISGGISQEISEVPRLKDRFGKQLGDSEEGVPLPQGGCGEMGKPTGRKERGAVWLTAKTCWTSLVKKQSGFLKKMGCPRGNWGTALAHSRL